MEVDLTVPQAEYFQSTSKATAAVAGFGSGKTQASMFRLFSTMLEYPDADMLYSAPTFPLIRDIFWAKLDEFLPSINLPYHINKSEGIVYVHGHGKIFCRSMDNPDRLVGFEVLDAFLDELDILPTEKALNVYRKCKARMRQKVKNQKETNKINQMFVSTTPEGFKATYELFKKNPIANSHLVKMSTYSNPHLPDDYIEDLRNSYPPQLIEAYLNGEFVNLVASPVWTGYDETKNIIFTPNQKPLSLQKQEPLHIGMDFNVGRGCAVVYVKRILPAQHPNNPTKNYKPTLEHPHRIPQSYTILIAINEVYNSFDTPDTIRVLEEYYPKHKYPNQIIYPDATGKNRKSVNATISDLSLLRQANFHIKKPNKNPPVKDRIASANACLCNGNRETRVYLDKNNVPNLSNALIQQVYDTNGLPKKGQSEFDDMTDSFSYPLSYMYPIKRNRMFSKNLGGT